MTRTKHDQRAPARKAAHRPAAAERERTRTEGHVGARVLRRAKSAARRIAGTSDRMELGEKALIGATVLGSAAAVTAVVLERRAIAKALAGGADMAARLGRAAAHATGVRRRPFYARPLPLVGAGLATSLIAASCATYLLLSRAASRRYGRLESEQAAANPGGETPAWDPRDPLRTLDDESPLSPRGGPDERP